MVTTPPTNSEVKLNLPPSGAPGAEKTRLDPVASRLISAGQQHAVGVIQWVEGQRQRASMRRRAVVCAMGGWSLVTVAAVVSAAVSVHLSRDIREIFIDQMGFEADAPRLVTILPWLLVAVAILIVVILAFGLLTGRLPGYSRTVSAIDWSAASDAVARLLSVGCTYPEAFRTAAKVTGTDPSRRWLVQAAARVERGGADSVSDTGSVGDAAILELLIDSATHQPQRQWTVAAEHFLDLARRRLVLLLQSTPMIATIISGLLIWVSISATLGWMWRAAAEMIRGMGY